MARVATSPSVNNLNTNLTIEEELKNRNITFNELNDDTRKVPYVSTRKTNYLETRVYELEGQTVTVNQSGELKSTFDQPIDLNISLGPDSTGLTEDDRVMITNNYLSDPSMFIAGLEYKNFWYISSQNSIYVRMTAYDGQPIVDGSAEIQIHLDDNYDMIGYTQTYQDKITTLNEAHEILTEREAIEIIDRRADTLIPNDSTIHYSVFVYYQSQELDDFNVYSPAWQIIYDNQNGRYTIVIDAIRGNVVRRNQIY